MAYAPGVGTAGAGAALGKVPVEATLNDRLNKLVEGLQYQCERLESVVARVNGNPQPQAPRTGDVAQIKPGLPMNAAMEHAEALHQRLADLATSIERIA